MVLSLKLDKKYIETPTFKGKEDIGIVFLGRLLGKSRCLPLIGLGVQARVQPQKTTFFPKTIAPT